MRYTATREPDGALRVKDVPIFVECERAVGEGEDRKVVQFDADWIREAVANAKADEAGGYHAPLHVRHHEKGREVRAAGFFQVKGAETIEFRGEERLAIMADLVITDPSVQADVIARRFPYRSVEIHKVARPSIDSLALLDHEAPFLRLPMLMVAEIGADVSGETLRRNPSPTVAASFRRGPAAALLFKMDDQDDKPKPQDDERDDASANTPPNGDKPNDEQQGEEVEAKSPDAKAIVEAIKSGEISVADLQAIVDAIHERGNATSAEPDAGDPDGDKPARAPAPGQSMQDAPDSTSTHMTTDTKTADKAAAEAAEFKAKADAATVQMAALQGEVDALKAKDKARDAADKRAKDVAEGLKRLANRPAGSDLEAKLGALHDKSPEAMFAYVEAIEKALPIAGSSATSGAPAFAGIGQKVPDVAMKYLDKGGNDAVDAAAKFCAEWERQRGLGLSQTQEQYVELHMRRRAARAAELATAGAGR